MLPPSDWGDGWLLAFGNFLPSAHRISAAHCWAHGHLSDWETFSPDFSVQSDSRLWEESRLSQTTFISEWWRLRSSWGPSAQWKCFCSFSRSLPGHSHVQSLWALRESLNLRVWILWSTISRKCVVWLFKHSFSFVKLSYLTYDHVSQHPLKNI